MHPRPASPGSDDQRRNRSPPWGAAVALHGQPAVSATAVQLSANPSHGQRFLPEPPEAGRDDLHPPRRDDGHGDRLTATEGTTTRSRALQRGRPMTTSHEWHLVRRPHGEPVDDGLRPRRGRAARAGRRARSLVRNTLLSRRPLHARPDERREVLRARRSSSTSRWTAARSGVVEPSSRRPDADGRAVRSATPSCTASAGAATPCCRPAGTRVLDTDRGPAQAYLGVLGMPGLHRVRRAAATSARSRRATWSSSPPRPAPWARWSARSPGSRVPAWSSAAPAGRTRPGGCSTTPASTRRVDYKAGRSPSGLREAAPDGIDVYFDNVGGDHLEAAIGALRLHGRAALCGVISAYNDTEPPPGPAQPDLD